MFHNINKNQTYVKSIQTQLGLEVDGIAGPETLKAVEDDLSSQVIQHLGQFVPIAFEGKIRHDYSLDVLPDGTKNWYYRKNKIDNIVVHWGGLNASHCFMVFHNPKYAHTSSHFLIGRNPNNGELEVYQCLDTGLVAYHAGKANKQSVGVDICMHPDTKYFAKTKKWYPGAEIVPNPSARGPQKDIVDIDPELADFASQFLSALRDVLELSHKPVCSDDEIYALEPAKQFSILGHHNISVKKWDPAPYADRLYHHLDAMS